MPFAQERNEDWKEEAEGKKERIKKRLEGGEILGKKRASYVACTTRLGNRRQEERSGIAERESIALAVPRHGISIDIYTVSMGISTRSESGRARPRQADSDPARSTQTGGSIVAFKLPSHRGLSSVVLE